MISCKEKENTTTDNIDVVEVISEIKDDYFVSDSLEINSPNKESFNNDSFDSTLENSSVIGNHSDVNGTLTYKIDTLLIVGVTSRVEARISKLSNDTITDYLVSITHESYSGKIETTNVKIGDIMDMELVSINIDAFNIEKISPDEQPIEEDYIATWIWAITPLKTGKHNLILRAYIKEDDDLVKFETIFDKTITVENKPKKNYRYEFVIPSELKKYNEELVFLDIYEDNDEYDFQWGNDGKIILEFNEIINIRANNNYYIEYNKSVFNYRWIIEPMTIGEINYTLKIVGDYEELILEQNTIKVKRNIGESFNRFVDVALKRWYFLFTTLIIPLYMFIKKKYFKKERKNNT
ncbi:MAG: hypothetical protein ACOC3V_01590 [bacterium]